jgi:carboxyl-terminal processing protease
MANHPRRTGFPCPLPAGLIHALYRLETCLTQRGITMSWRYLLGPLPLLLAIAALAADPTEGTKAEPSAVLARRVWAVTEVVLDRHLEPPARQEMLLGGLRALYQAAKTNPPADLQRRASDITRPEQLTALLREAWPRLGAVERPEGVFIAGLCKKVPGRTHVIPPEVHAIQEQTLHNRYIGTGIQIRINKEEDYIQIVTPIRGGPAHKAGARPGDLIVAVDGQDMKGVSITKMVELLRGNEGVPVTMSVRRPGAAEKRDLKIVRGVVPFDNVYGYRRAKDGGWEYRISPDEPVGYVWLSALTSSTLHELRHVERTLQAEGVKALVLDLRGGGGAGVHQAALVADGLLDGGVMWRVRDGRNEVAEQKADRGCIFRGLPLAVLVSRHATPEADGVGHELLVAALQDNGRAVVVGEATRGDGFVQTPVPLTENQGVLVLRTGAIERPAARRTGPAPEKESAQDQPRGGIQPDHRVELTQKQHAAIIEWWQQKGLSELPEGVSDKAPDDPQLARAVEALRAALKGSGGGEKPR